MPYRESDEEYFLANRPADNDVSLFLRRMVNIGKELPFLVLEDLFALIWLESVFCEDFVSVVVVPFETDNIGKDPHAGSVYTILHSVNRNYPHHMLCHSGGHA